MTDEREAPLSRQAGRITDARGRTVSQLDPVMMHLLRRPGIIPAEVLADVARDVGLGITRATRWGFWASVVGVLCLVIAIAISATRLAGGTIGVSRFVRNLIPFMAIWGGLIGSWVSLRSTRHQRIGSAMLDRLRCPHCGYDLRGLPVDPNDGATVCPECGCAWKLPARAGSERPDGG